MVYLPESLPSMEMISDFQDNTNIYSKISQETCALPPKAQAIKMNECPLSIWVDSGKRLLIVLKTETSIYVGKECFITKNQYSKDLFPL